MNRTDKEQVIKELKQDFAQSEASFLVQYKGLDVQQMSLLRGQLRAQGGALKVAKINLMRLAIEGLPGIDDFVPQLKEQVALVFSSDESPATAKTLCAFAKQHEALSVLGGYFESKALSGQEVAVLAALPSKHVLRGQVAGTLQAPIRDYVRLLNMLVIRFLLVVKRIEGQKAGV